MIDFNTPIFTEKEIRKYIQEAIIKNRRLNGDE